MGERKAKTILSRFLEENIYGDDDDDTKENSSPRILHEENSNYDDDDDDDPKESSGRPWSDLPEVLLEDITSRLLLKDYLRFAAVCKSWRPVRHRSDIYSASSNQLWLMLLSKKDGACELIDPSCNKCYHSQFPELRGAIIFHSRDGWLLAKASFCSFFFFDPTTKEKLDLPRAHMCTACIFDCSAAFSASPASPDCVATLLCRPGGLNLSGVLIQTWRPGDTNWTATRLGTALRPCSSLPIVSPGAVMWERKRSNARVLDPPSHGWSWRHIDMKGVTELRRNRNWLDGDASALYITEFEGELFLICINAKKAASVGVYKINPSSMKVRRIKKLGSVTIYIDKTMAFMAPAMNSEMANKIFFPLKTIEGEHYYYSMEARKYFPPRQHFMQHCMGLEMRQKAFERSCWWVEEDLACIWVDPTRFKAHGGLVD